MADDLGYSDLGALKFIRLILIVWHKKVDF